MQNGEEMSYNGTRRKVSAYDLGIHPLADCWPRITDAVELDKFIEDVKQHGIRNPIVLYEGMVLDGRHRLEATKLLDIPCPAIDYQGDDPAGYVISQNAHRRHNSKLEIAMAVAKCREWMPPGRTLDVGTNARTEKQMAEEAGVSISTIKRAKRRIRGRETEKLKKIKLPSGPSRRDVWERRARALMKRVEDLEAETERLKIEIDYYKDQLDPSISKGAKMVKRQAREIQALKLTLSRFQVGGG